MDSVAPSEPIAKVARAAGVPAMRLRAQVARDSVSEASVVAAARGFKVSPLEALRAFPEFAHVYPARPTSAEAPAFIDTPVLLGALQWHLVGKRGHVPVPGEWDVKIASHRWFDAIVRPGTRAAVKDALGVDQSLLWRIVRNGLRADVAVVCAQEAGVSAASGFVAMGLLEPEEAGWPENALGDWLVQVPTVELIEVVRARLKDVGEQMQHDQTFKEFLG
jgi:hypothetical protein